MTGRARRAAAEAPAATGRPRAATASPDVRAKDPKARTVHMVGNAHIDAVWLWQWQEAFAEVKAMAGKQFDPTCAAAFLEIQDQILESMATLRQTSVFRAAVPV